MRAALISAGLVVCSLAIGSAVVTGSVWVRRPVAVPRQPAYFATDGRAAGLRLRYSEGHYPRIELPGGRNEIVRSVLNITGPMTFGSFVWNDTGVPQGQLWIRIDLANQLLSVFRSSEEIGSTVIIYGADGKPTPRGAFTILQKSKDYRSRSYDAPMPFMLRLTDDGVAIHASKVTAGYATHGCIGVPREFARHLFDAVAIGDPVFILPTSRAAGGT